MSLCLVLDDLTEKASFDTLIPGLYRSSLIYGTSQESKEVLGRESSGGFFSTCDQKSSRSSFLDILIRYPQADAAADLSTRAFARGNLLWLIGLDTSYSCDVLRHADGDFFLLVTPSEDYETVPQVLLSVTQPT
ncbi:hypothetical protein QAD02_015823 [Eretmocerus hayati]|uniref:Uncharacterized protein n=1 Tax=Eretmocerus hayati TaxID=131215 RepID=A0ACC2PB30_9HYME|nr:hypothetical protein QAD02_015823 [Eretmocerus hayati]